MLHNFDVRGALRKFSEETELIENMINSLVQAGATRQQAEERVARIMRNSVIDAENLLRNVAIEQANANK